MRGFVRSWHTISAQRYKKTLVKKTQSDSGGQRHACSICSRHPRLYVRSIRLSTGRRRFDPNEHGQFQISVNDVQHTLCSKNPVNARSSFRSRRMYSCFASHCVLDPARGARRQRPVRNGIHAQRSPGMSAMLRSRSAEAIQALIESSAVLDHAARSQAHRYICKRFVAIAPIAKCVHAKHPWRHMTLFMAPQLRS